MSHLNQSQTWNSEVRRRGVGASLALVVVLVSAIVAAGTSPAQTLTVLYSFTGSPDGGNPSGGLVMDSNGNLYGATYDGGSLLCYPDGCGTVFKVDPTGKETVLYTFTGAQDGAFPTGALLRATGSLFGTTVQGGGSGFGAGYGVVFKVNKKGVQTVLHTFHPDGTDGTYPGALVRDSAGNLHGVTSQGGNLNCGLAPPARLRHCFQTRSTRQRNCVA